MDVNDLKGLFAEVNKRMDTVLEHLKHELAGVRTGRATVGILDPRPRRGLRIADAAQPARRACRSPSRR